MSTVSTFLFLYWQIVFWQTLFHNCHQRTCSRCRRVPAILFLVLGNLFCLPFWFHSNQHQQISSTHDILAREDVVDGAPAGNITVKDQHPRGNILSGGQIVPETGSNNNGTKSEEGTKRKRRRRRKKKEKKGEMELPRKAYNESKLREEWEDYIFNR